MPMVYPNQCWIQSDFYIYSGTDPSFSSAQMLTLVDLLLRYLNSQLVGYQFKSLTTALHNQPLEYRIRTIKKEHILKNSCKKEENYIKLKIIQ